MVSRVYVEKKPGFDGEARQLADELRSLLGIEALENLRLVNRYDVEGISDELFAQCVPTVFSEPPVDAVYDSLPAADMVSTTPLGRDFSGLALPQKKSQKSPS